MLRFHNEYPATVSVCISWLHVNCEDGGDWEKAGWYVMDPGQTRTAHNADLADINQFWYYFAFATDGRFWAGDFVDTVPFTAFDWCEKTSSTESHQIGYRQLDIGSSDNYTLTLAPPP